MVCNVWHTVCNLIQPDYIPLCVYLCRNGPHTCRETGTISLEEEKHNERESCNGQRNDSEKAGTRESQNELDNLEEVQKNENERVRLCKLKKQKERLEALSDFVIVKVSSNSQ